MSINRLQRPRLVVVGNGMAGMRTVEELVARAPDRFDITVIGGEPHPSYNRILLSSVLAGERTIAEIVIQPSSWYAKHSIHLIAGNHATAIDPVTRRVALADGATVPYDKLLLATGSKPLAPPIPALTLPMCAPSAISPMSRQFMKFEGPRIILSRSISRFQKGIEIKRRIPSMLSPHPPKTWTLIWKTIFRAIFY